MTLTSTSLHRFERYLVILCAERDFHSVKREAERVSNASGVQFSMRGNVWDSTKSQLVIALRYVMAAVDWILAVVREN